MIRRTCVVYSVNALAQEAACAALVEDVHVERSRALVARGKAFVLEHARRLGLPVICGEGNFVMIRVPMSDSLAYRRLLKRGVMVRTMTGFRFPNYIRVTIASEEAMTALVEALAAEVCG